MFTFSGLGGSHNSWLQTQKTAHYWIWINIKTASGIGFMFLVFVHELNQISIHFNMPASTGWTRGGLMIDAGQERSRWWPSILVLHLHSGSVGPASRVDFGQFYKIILYNISYLYMYTHYNKPSMSPYWDVTNWFNPLTAGAAYIRVFIFY